MAETQTLAKIRTHVEFKASKVSIYMLKNTKNIYFKTVSHLIKDYARNF